MRSPQRPRRSSTSRKATTGHRSTRRPSTTRTGRRYVTTTCSRSTTRTRRSGSLPPRSPPAAPAPLRSASCASSTWVPRRTRPPQRCRTTCSFMPFRTKSPRKPDRGPSPSSPSPSKLHRSRWTSGALTSSCGGATSAATTAAGNAGISWRGRRRTPRRS
ncbi:hypothetical protein DFJ74DRAFT_648401 [Hyaloraphidium curvatum]|nr:hypothetical protein DFJ74DRAFT_648401 [Hyaloraphidium curvatum]